MIAFGRRNPAGKQVFVVGEEATILEDRLGVDVRKVRWQEIEMRLVGCLSVHRYIGSTPRRFKSAWDAVLYTVGHLEDLEARTRMFAQTLRESTLPAEVKEAASANLSTLATTTCFRTADGEFHGFEGSDDTRGCCFGNCTHVWNYETTTAFLFPSFARSLRRNAFGYSMDDAGAIHFRQMLPDGKARSGFAAADGQMGQILHAWLDWKISGDEELLREYLASRKEGS